MSRDLGEMIDLVGRQVEIETRSPHKELEGELKGITNDRGLELETDKERTYRIPLRKVVDFREA